MELEIPNNGTKKITVYPCIECGCDNIIIGDCGYSSFNVAYGKCTNPECKREVKFNCGWNISKEDIAGAWNAKNNPNIKSKFAGSNIGSTHWFRTVMSTILHTGEYLSEKTPEPEMLRQWGHNLYARSQEILDWYEKIPDDLKEKMDLTK